MPFVDFRLPSIPAPSQTYIGRSVSSLQPLASDALHAMGWRFRRVTSTVWTWVDSFGYAHIPPASDTRRVRIRVSPIAQYLHVTFVYQAHGGVSSRRVQVSLYTIAGALQDGPITFESMDGTLVNQTVAKFVGFDEYPHLTQHTGTDLRPNADDRLGLLIVPSAARGVECEVRFACTSVRLRSATIWEWPLVQI